MLFSKRKTWFNDHNFPKDWAVGYIKNVKRSSTIPSLNYSSPTFSKQFQTFPHKPSFSKQCFFSLLPLSLSLFLASSLQPGADPICLWLYNARTALQQSRKRPPLRPVPLPHTHTATTQQWVKSPRPLDFARRLYLQTNKARNCDSARALTHAYRKSSAGDDVF